MTPPQSNYIEVTQGTIFIEQNIRLGLILGWLSILKKELGPIMSNFLGLFSCFQWPKKNLRIYLDFF
jgi:hypothetical protein